MMRPSPERVAQHFLMARRLAARHLRALVVPPRRDREYAMYHAFLKSLKADIAAVEAARGVVDKADDLLWGAGMTSSRMPTWDSAKFISTFERDLGDRKDIPTVMWPEGYVQDRQHVRQWIQYTLESAQKDQRLFRKWAEELAEAVASRDFEDGLEYADLSDQEVRQLRALPALAQRIPTAIDMLLKRMARTRDPSMDENIPSSAEAQDRETLYHASVNARTLAQEGFSLTMPEGDSSAGLGGSQSAGGGKKGISFTEDAYVAKEIARVLKEVAMIARGEVSAEAVAEWARKTGHLDKIIDWYKTNYSKHDKFKTQITAERDGIHVLGLDEDARADYVKAVRSGEVEYDSRKTFWKRMPFRSVFSDPVDAMGLYLSYLNFSGRYDPKFFGVGGPRGLVQRFHGLSPRNIGYIAATVDMNNPHVTYGKGEREFRVPPEAVISVDRFIG